MTIKIICCTCCQQSHLGLFKIISIGLGALLGRQVLRVSFEHKTLFVKTYPTSQTHTSYSSDLQSFTTRAMDPILSKATDLHLAMDDSSVLQAAKDLFLFASTIREDASFSIKPTEHMTKIPSSLALSNEIDTISSAVATNSSHSKNEADTGVVDGALSHKKKYLPHEPFPVILLRMVKDESINHIITFLPHGQSFVILDQEKLMSDALPVYFPGTTSKVFASF